MFFHNHHNRIEILQIYIVLVLSHQGCTKLPKNSYILINDDFINFIKLTRAYFVRKCSNITVWSLKVFFF